MNCLQPLKEMCNLSEVSEEISPVLVLLMFSIYCMPVTQFRNNCEIIHVFNGVLAPGMFVDY